MKFEGKTSQTKYTYGLKKNFKKLNTWLLSMVQALSKKILQCHWIFFLPMWTEYVLVDGSRTLDTCTQHFCATALENSSEDDRNSLS